MNKESLEKILDRYPTLTSWSNTVREGGVYVGMMYGVFAERQHFDYIREVLGHCGIREYMGGGTWLVK